MENTWFYLYIPSEGVKFSFPSRVVYNDYRYNHYEYNHFLPGKGPDTGSTKYFNHVGANAIKDIGHIWDNPICLILSGCGGSCFGNNSPLNQQFPIPGKDHSSCFPPERYGMVRGGPGSLCFLDLCYDLQCFAILFCNTYSVHMGPDH